MNLGEEGGLDHYSYHQRDGLEEKLCAAFEKVLNVEKVEPEDNFFELGGDLLSGGKIILEMNLEDLSIIEIFQGETPKRIALLYRDKIIGKDDDITEEERELSARREAHSIPRVQINVIDFQLFSPMAPMWTFPFLLSFGAEADVERIYNAARKVIEWHTIFSTIYEFDRNCVLQQRFDPSSKVELVVEHMSDEEFEKIKSEPSAPFKILGGPMIRLRMIVTESDTYLLMTVHHVVMDSESIRIIFNNLVNAYLGEELVLDTYYTYLAVEDALSYTAAYKEAFKYYKENYIGIDWCENLTPDKKDFGNVMATYVIGHKCTPAMLQEFEKNCKILKHGLFDAVVVLTLAKLSGKRNILTSFVFADRVSKQKQTACGMLEKMIPMGVCLDKCETLADLYKYIKRKTSEGVGNCAYDWGILREIPYINDIISIDYIKFSDREYPSLSKIGARLIALDSHNKTALHRTMLKITEMPETVEIRLSYMETCYSEERIKEFSDLLTRYTNQLIEIKNPEEVRLAELLR